MTLILSFCHKWPRFTFFYVPLFSNFNFAQKQVFYYIWYHPFYRTYHISILLLPPSSPIPLRTWATCRYLSFIICLSILILYPSKYLILSRETAFCLIIDQFFYRKCTLSFLNVKPRPLRRIHKYHLQNSK